MPKNNPVDECVLNLEKLCRKVIRVGFKDNTLDYTVQISATSLEPGKVKYGFMINGLKKEIQPIALAFTNYEDCKAVLEGMLNEVNPLEVEKMFHKGRINVYSHAISSHQERLDKIEKDGLEVDDGIPMEEVEINE
jgi:hypothetical protein